MRKTKITFILILLYTGLITAAWLYFLISGESFFLFAKKSDFNKIAYKMFSVIFVFGIWSYGLYFLKYFLLKKIGFTAEDLTIVFSNRQAGFDLQNILLKYPERKIRVIDMITRRGRTVPMVLQNFIIPYLFLKNAASLTLAFQGGTLVSLIVSWMMIATFYKNGILGHVFYGAHTRIMDGVLGRANVLCITTLWSSFQFVMIPLSLLLAPLFPQATYASLFAIIWFPYVAVDFASEIFGAILGKQKIKVWGLGDINRKSIAGTIAGFTAGLIVSFGIVAVSALPPSWFILALIIALSTTIFELYAPRPSDDFFMATANALICLVFGIVIY